MVLLIILLAAAIVAPAAVDQLGQSPEPQSAPPAPPEPATHGGAVSRDFIALGPKPSGGIEAAFHGHTPSLPVPAGSVASWGWTNLTVTAGPGTKDADLAFSREGYALAVWSVFTFLFAAFTCDSDGDGFPDTFTDFAKSDIYISKWNGSGWNQTTLLIAGAPDFWYGYPSIAIDATGRFIVSYSERHVGRINGCYYPWTAENRLYYGVWAGGSFANVIPPTLVDGPSVSTGALQSVVTFDSTLALSGSVTMNRAVLAWILPLSCPPFAAPTYNEVRAGSWDGATVGGVATIPGTPDLLTSPRQIEASADKLGNVVVVWGGEFDGNVDPCDSSPGTAEFWAAQHRAGWIAVGPRDVSSGTMSQGAVSFQYNDTGVVVYTRSTGGVNEIWYTLFQNGTWSPIAFLYDAETSNDPHIASDHYGRTVAVWRTGSTAKNATWGATGWSTVGVVVGLGGSYAVAAHSSSPSAALAEWSIYDYVCEDTTKLGNFGTIDLNEAATVGSSLGVNFVALIDENLSAQPMPDQNSVFFVERGSLHRRGDWVHPGAATLNMGSPTILRDFIAWSLEHYPANKTMLDIEDHGGATEGVCWDAMGTYLPGQDGDDDQLTLGNLSAGLDAALGTGRLDVIGFDACCMANFETAYQVRNRADWMDGSENTEPGPGWDYRSIMQNLTTLHRRTPQNVSEVVWSSYVALYGSDVRPGGVETFSVFDLGRLRTGPLATDVFELGTALTAALPANYAAINGSVHNASWTNCACSYGGIHLDLRNLSHQFQLRVPSAAVIANATQVMAEIPNVVTKSFVDPVGDWPVGWAASYGSEYHGMSIYMAVIGFDADYNGTASSTDGTWDEFNWAYAQAVGGAVPEVGLVAVVAALSMLTGLVWHRARGHRRRNRP